MDARPTPSGSRTPQPPANGSSKQAASQPRSRGSTPTGASTVPTATASPARSAVANARVAVAPRQPRVASTSHNTSNNNNHSGSPRAAAPTTRRSSSDEPAVDEDDAVTARFREPPKDEWLRESQAALASMKKQAQDAAKRTLKHHTRCATMREAMAGKEERMDSLRGTYAAMTRALDELELFSTGELDADALETLYNSLPSDARAAPLVPADSS